MLKGNRNLRLKAETRKGYTKVAVTKVMMVEDEPLFRDLLTRTLTNEPGLEVVGIAEDGEAAVKLFKEVNPDVVLMDIELPGEIDGIDAAIKIKKESPLTGIVILSVHSDRRYVASLPLENGRGWAYLLKQTVPDLAMVVRAIEGTKAGMLVLDPLIVRSLRPREGSRFARLTARQQEVLELMSQGYNNAAIAERLGLSGKSVETYINVIYQALGLSNEQEINARVKAPLLYLDDTWENQ